MTRLVAWSVAITLSIACRESTEPAPAPLGWGAVVRTAVGREVSAGFAGRDGKVLAGTLCLPAVEGSYAAVVFHFGSDRWTAPSCGSVVGWTSIGIAALVYDKRGVGRSQGRCCPWRAPGYFELLADDVTSGARLLSTWPEVDRTRLGAYGFSQGGWVVPTAAARSPELIRWSIIGSGPAVTLGEELLYSALSGDAACKTSSLSEAELEARLTAAGKSGFDPEPFLARSVNPSLWIFGGLDRSIPVARSVTNLERLRQANALPITIVTIPNMNHSWIVDGGPCQSQGVRWNDHQVIGPWLRAVGVTAP